MVQCFKIRVGEDRRKTEEDFYKMDQRMCIARGVRFPKTTTGMMIALSVTCII